MHTFEITIQRKFGNDWPVVALREHDDSALPIRTEGYLRLNRGELNNTISPRDYGVFLGKALFDDKISRAFDQAREASQDRLHVLLFIEDDNLRSLRWERLCAPFEFGWDFLCLNQRVPFSLYLPSTADRRFPPIGRGELRTLILAASPKNLSGYLLDEFDAPAAAASVRAALRDIPNDILAIGEGTIGPPTLNALIKNITNGTYSLMHLICHGRFDSDSGETALYLANDNNEVASVSGSDLIIELSRLGAKGLPHFVFLSACEAGTPEAEEALGSLANQLVRKLGIPAVVAMTGQISVDTAALLSSAFYQRLRVHGQVDLALVEAYAGLTNREDINVPTLYSRLGGRPLFSETTQEVLTPQIVGSGLNLLQSLLNDRAPILRKDFDEQAERLRNALAATSRVETEKQKDEALVELSGISQEVLELSFESLAFGKTPPTYDSRSPFRGLYPFRSEDQEFFFGREVLIEKLRGKLEVDNFLAVLGPSGSGKSSVVLAGLIPLLQGDGCELIYLTPGPEPLAALRLKLQEVEASQNPIIVVDQFEELFTHGVSQSECNEFLRLLLSQEVKTVLTMRADFWGECAGYGDLKERMQANQELIAPMDSAELRRAMELQAGKVGLRFEADLSSQILDDVQDEPGAMPLLQHALQELWRRRHGRWLRADEYRNLGGVKMSIARSADEVYEKLSKSDQDQVREILLRLTRIDEDDTEGRERRDTRQRVRLESLVPADGDVASTKKLVKLLADARLVVTSRNVHTGQEEVEVAHEALIRYWPKLRNWLDRDRMGLIIHRSLMRAVDEWLQNQRDNSYLYEGVRLTNAKRWAVDNLNSLNSQEREFLFASILEENNEIGEWINRYGGPEKTLDLAGKYLSAGHVDERAKGLSILGSISSPEAEQAIDELLLKSIVHDASETVSLRAAEVLDERHRTEWFVEQLNKPENKPHRKQLIRALAHLRNRPGLGVEVSQIARRILPPTLRRAISFKALRRLIYTYRTQFAIVLSFTFIATQIGLEVMSRLTSLVQRRWAIDAPVGLPYGSFNLIATVLCGLYVLLRATLDRRSITIKDCFRAALWGTLLSEFIFIFGRVIEELFRAIMPGGNPARSIASVLVNGIDTLVGMTIVALVLRVITRDKSPRRYFAVLSGIAAALTILWQRIVGAVLFGLIYGSSVSLGLKPLSLLLSWLLGASITFASFLGFRFGVRMSADVDFFRDSLGLEQTEKNKLVLQRSTGSKAEV